MSVPGPEGGAPARVPARPLQGVPRGARAWGAVVLAVSVVGVAAQAVGQGGLLAGGWVALALQVLGVGLVCGVAHLLRLPAGVAAVSALLAAVSPLGVAARAEVHRGTAAPALLALSVLAVPLLVAAAAGRRGGPRRTARRREDLSAPALAAAGLTAVAAVAALSPGAVLGARQAGGAAALGAAVALDPMLPLLGVLAAVVGLVVPGLRLTGLALLLMPPLVLLFDLPLASTVPAVPLAALVVAGAVEAVRQRLAARSRTEDRPARRPGPLLALTGAVALAVLVPLWTAGLQALAQTEGGRVDGVTAEGGRSAGGPATTSAPAASPTTPAASPTTPGASPSTPGASPSAPCPPTPGAPARSAPLTPDPGASSVPLHTIAPVPAEPAAAVALSANPHVRLAPPAQDVLSDQPVDSRLVALLAQLAAGRVLSVADLPAADPPDCPVAPRRAVVLDGLDDRPLDEQPQAVDALLAELAAQEPGIRPTTARRPGPDGRQQLVVELPPTS